MNMAARGERRRSVVEGVVDGRRPINGGDGGGEIDQGQRWCGGVGQGGGGLFRAGGGVGDGPGGSVEGGLYRGGVGVGGVGGGLSAARGVGSGGNRRGDVVDGGCAGGGQHPHE
ncbi:hypothetical protein [Streptomyces noursei]|uniref:hypothetical protein n=1 Tax=Streptomyces noursei TaxID=1971 RepID=UPI001F0444C4|nr:hypothetical protein [Streptomyces noursei]